MPKSKNSKIEKLSHTVMVQLDKIPHKSRVGSPVQLCWEVFSEHRQRLGDNMSRKKAIDDCMKRGVAFYTARTQYQEWKAAGDNDRKVAARGIVTGISAPYGTNLQNIRK